ncbi:MAG: sulfate/molybdate ABC transporter ATP-binding protein [Mobilitalea sp.]
MSLLIDIHKKYKDFSLDIKFDNTGKLLGLLGASGCGKSLTLKCIAGIENPDYGKIILNDRILYDSDQGINIPPRQRNIGLLFQNYALFPNMNVKENIEIGVRNKKNKKIIVEKMSILFRLDGMLNRYPHQLSGGEQQRVALARIMAYEPEVLMLDEPFSALDSFLKDQLQQELLEVLKEFRGDVLMVSHSRDELYRFCNTIAVINRGQMVEIGNKIDVFSKPTDITTAKLTGCKNISRAVRISDYEVNAIDWNICIKMEQIVANDVCYVGIRAHNIKAGPNGEGENTIPVSLAGFSEGPFENSLILKNKNQLLERGKLWWIVSKQEWNNTLQEQFPSHITLPKEHILLLTDNS